MKAIKSLVVRDRSNVDDMGLILSVLLTVMSLAWTFS